MKAKHFEAENLFSHRTIFQHQPCPILGKVGLLFSTRQYDLMTFPSKNLWQISYQKTKKVAAKNSYLYRKISVAKTFRSFHSQFGRLDGEASASASTASQTRLRSEYFAGRGWDGPSRTTPSLRPKILSWRLPECREKQKKCNKK